VADLVAELGRHPRTVAVEHNGDILPRDRYATTPLAPGDRLEIVHFVQGG
jgi:thiamine biosynthesis protein ThiS